jgi:hypothetical protein
MIGVGLPEPAWRDGELYACTRYGAGVHCRGGREHRRVEACALTEAEQRAPDRRRQQHDARLVAFAEDGRLAAVGPRLQVVPGERGDLRDAQPGDREQSRQDRLPPICGTKPDYGDEVSGKYASPPHARPVVTKCQP